MLTQVERKLDLKNKFRLEVLIEDVAAMVNVDSIAVSSARLESIVFGSLDFAASQGIDTLPF